MWDVDRIPTGPGLVKRHGVLDVNWTAPAAPTDGAPGADGQGVPTGGTTHQLLRKVSGTDYDTEWATIPPTAVDGGAATTTTFTDAIDGGNA